MKRFFKVLGWITAVFILLTVIFLFMIWLPEPAVDRNIRPENYTRIQVAPGHYRVNNCWLKKNRFGIWEMYLEGDAYERGVIYGVLAKELIGEQESYFVKQIREIIPNDLYLQFLKFFVAFFNRNIHEHVPDENLQEIYGISLSFSDEYDFIGPKYYRILNYHAAHDIGHALNDYQMVGCTSFAVNKALSEDGTLLLGRNFDFTMGDDFARDKLLVFMNPDKGYKFASYSWAGFTGVVSGMNEKGLTVTINASKSDVPLGAKDPVSLLAREILQYASNIDEAIAIAEKRELFVSESLLIGSAIDNKAVIIEKSPSKMDVYETANDKLVCANHYQGEAFINDSVNIKNIQNSDSRYRFMRMNELLDSAGKVSVTDAANILRNVKGIGNEEVGFGNPKAINQLIAHHSVIFRPQQKQFWFSTSPYQLGTYVHYDLAAVFGGIAYDSLHIAPDSFMYSDAYKRYESYKIIKQKINKFTLFGIPFELTSAEADAFIADNPQSYITYMVLGDYYKTSNDYRQAIDYYNQSLNHAVASLNEEQSIKKRIEECNQALTR